MYTRHNGDCCNEDERESWAVVASSELTENILGSKTTREKIKNHCRQRSSKKFKKTRTAKERKRERKVRLFRGERSPARGGGGKSEFL